MRKFPQRHPAGPSHGRVAQSHPLSPQGGLGSSANARFFMPVPHRPRCTLHRSFAATLPVLSLFFWAVATTSVRAASPVTAPKLPTNWPSPPPIAAKALVVMDARTGQILAERNPNLRVQPASLAKIMTFDLALRAIHDGQFTPQSTVTVGMAAWKVALNPNASRMFLQIGTKVSMKDLLIGLMVPSGDDAAVQVADSVAGSQAAFVAEMNREARRLGLSNTHFENASGLGAPGQYSTALDMAVLTHHLITTYPNFKTYTDIQWFTWNHITQQNFNRLVGVVPWVTGLKSGHLGGPDFHLVTTAQKGSRSLIGVVLGTPSLMSSASESESLLNWAFHSFHPESVPLSRIPTTQTVYEGTTGQVSLALNGGDALPNQVDVPTIWGRTGPIHVRVRLKPEVVAPVRQGEVLGSVAILAGSHSLERRTIVAKSAVPQGGFFAVLFGRIALLFRHL